MLKRLGSVLKKSIKKIGSAIFIDKKLIDSIIRDLQRAMIEADINVQLVKELSERIRKAALDEKVKGIEKREHIIKILHDELLHLLGDKKYEMKLEKVRKKKWKKKTNLIMLVGLYGSGKTTTIAKLSSYYSKRGYKTCMLGLDVHRLAAPEQLEQLAKQAKLTAFTDKKEKNPIKIWKKYKKQLDKFDAVFIDTAGRHNLNKALIKEIKLLGKEIKPSYTLLVMPADIGQAAKKQAAEFQKACTINGIIITRMDSSAKGGGALTACAETKAPVFFITTGEKIHDIESFSPSSFISRILGLGDLETLIEKVKSAIDEKKQKKIQKRLKEGKLTLFDVQEQIKAMQNMGPLGKIAGLIPGMGKIKIPKKLLGTQEEKIKKWQHIIKSMTREEIENPEIIEKQTTRISRIAKGSGSSASDVRTLLKQYKLLKDFTSSSPDLEKGISQKQLQKLAKKFGKKFGKKIKL